MRSELIKGRLGAVTALVVLLACGYAPQVANAGSMIEVDGRYITIFGRTFCMFRCDEPVDSTPLTRQPAAKRPKPH